MALQKVSDKPIMVQEWIKFIYSAVETEVIFFSFQRTLGIDLNVMKRNFVM